MENIFNIQERLLEMGYRYFLYENTESIDSGDTIFHYTLFPDSIELRNDKDKAIRLDSNGGFDIIEDFIHGEVKIHLYSGSKLHVDEFGILYKRLEFKFLKLKSI